MWLRPRLLRAAFVACCVSVVLPASPAVQARDVPSRLDDKAFWGLVTDFSETGGRFPSDNFVSNEIYYQTVLPKLTKTIQPGGIYVGVGPDQNFTYIVGLKPRMAFIVDIRRQNLLHHLLYKAIAELSPNRAAYLSRLFGRPMPVKVKDTDGPDAMLDELSSAPMPSEATFNALVSDVITRLERHHKFMLSDVDKDTMRYVYQAFVTSGPMLSYASSLGYMIMQDGRIISPTSPYPTFGEILMRHDGTGINRSYLGTEANYQVLREMHQRNAIVPIVGDFAGPRALRSLAAYLHQRRAVVTTFYTSNVEQYLFQNHAWREFYDNVSALPLDKTSAFIRSDFITQRLMAVDSSPRNGAHEPHRPLRASATLTCSIQDLLAAVADGRIATYLEVLMFAR